MREFKGIARDARVAKSVHESNEVAGHLLLTPGALVLTRGMFRDA